MGGHPHRVYSHVGGRGRHRAPRCHGVAVRTRRHVRALPDLPQRTLALRTAPRSDRSRLPAHVRRPDARSKDAAVTGTLGTELVPTQPPRAGRAHAENTTAAGRPCHGRPDQRGPFERSSRRYYTNHWWNIVKILKVNNLSKVYGKGDTQIKA